MARSIETDRTVDSPGRSRARRGVCHPSSRANNIFLGGRTFSLDFVLFKGVRLVDTHLKVAKVVRIRYLARGWNIDEAQRRSLASASVERDIVDRIPL